MNPLAELRDIHLPAAPGWWPPAPGWWALAGLVVLAVLLLRGPLGRLRRRRRLLGRLHGELDALRRRAEQGGAPRQLAAELSTLLRRVALARHPRHQVAGLSGEAWLRFLDRTGGGEAFSAGAGRALARLPYAPDDVAEVDLQALLAAARGWLERNA